MQLGEIIRSFSEEAPAQAALLACNDIVMFARVGEAQFDRSISLRDDVTDPATLGLPFDIEGTPKQPLDLVRDGVTRGLLHTRRTARAGTPSAAAASVRPAPR